MLTLREYCGLQTVPAQDRAKTGASWLLCNDLHHLVRGAGVAAHLGAFSTTALAYRARLLTWSIYAEQITSRNIIAWDRTACTVRVSLK